MDEVFAQDPQKHLRRDTSSNDEQNGIEILLLTTKWQFDTYGLSTINKSLVNNLRVVDPEGENIKNYVRCGRRRRKYNGR